MKLSRIILLTFFTFTIILFPPGASIGERTRPGNKTDAQKTKEALVGMAVKSIAKGYIATADLEKLKETNIAKIENMDDKEFKTKYRKIYTELNEIPEDVRNDYGFTEDMEKKTAIEQMRSATKNDLYRIIDSIPDSYIKKHFDAYIAEKHKRLSMQSLMRFWDDLKGRIESR